MAKSDNIIDRVRLRRKNLTSRTETEEEIMRIFFYYLILINLYGFLVMYSDKKKSKTGKWRTPENRIFAIAGAFGTLGIFIGMRVCRHKTKHNKFVVGIPLILVVQLYVTLKYIFKVL